MGGEVNVFNQREIAGELVADIRVQYSENLKGCEISGEDIPRLIDELPVIAVLASQAEGETIVRNAGDLRNKEADRISCLVKVANILLLCLLSLPNFLYAIIVPPYLINLHHVILIPYL